MKTGLPKFAKKSIVIELQINSNRMEFLRVS